MRLIAAVVSLVVLCGVILPSSLASAKAVAAACALLLVFLFAQLVKRHSNPNQNMPESQVPRALTHRPELCLVHASLTHSLAELARYSDETFREATILKLCAVQEELRTLAAGKLVFSETEAWRTSYERILRTPGMARYLSVAWLRSEVYWRNAPGRHSMRLNYDLIQLGMRVERTLILHDAFWPLGAALPAKAISDWIEEQYKHGIVVRLVRESEIADEPELLCDFGIYGDRATGLLELDEQCETANFTLDFDASSVRVFQERWRRLLLFAVSFRELLDQRARSA